MVKIKLSLVIVTFFLFLLISSKKIDKSENLVEKSIASIAEQHFTKDSNFVEIIIFGEIDPKLFEKSLKSGSVLFRLTKFGVIDDLKFKDKTDSAIILLFDSRETFKSSLNEIQWQPNKNRRFQRLVYIVDVTKIDLEGIEDGFSIDHVSFLLHDENSMNLELVASFMYTASACKKNQIKKINKFSASTQKWENSDFFPQKYRDLHGCTLKVLYTLDPSARYLQQFHDFMHQVSLLLNFDLDAVGKQTYNFSEEKGYDLGLSSHIELRGDMQFGFLLRTEVTFFVGPPGDLLTPFEKMFLTYDLETWILIAFTLVTGLVVIQIINRCQVEIQKFVFGSRVRTPTMNLVEQFLCGGQNQLPGRNFSRFLLMMFIIWCLIIRTCYQSTLFLFLQSDPRKPGVTTALELYEKNFTYAIGSFDVVTCERMLNHYWRRFDLPEFQCEKINVSASSITWTNHNLIDAVTEPENKFFTMMSSVGLLWRQQFSFRSGLISLRPVSEPYNLYHWSIQHSPYSPYAETLNSVFQRLIENGMLQISLSEILMTKHDKKDEEIGPQVLTMDHLEIGFIFCLFPLILCFLTFFGELFWFWLSKK